MEERQDNREDNNLKDKADMETPGQAPEPQLTDAKSAEDTENAKEENLPKPEATPNPGRPANGPRPARPGRAATAPARNPAPRPQPEEAGTDEDMATPEEVAAFLRDRRQEKEQRKHTVDNTAEDAKDMEQIQEGQEPPVDPYLEPDPEVPHVPYTETPFLWRGCNHCPTSYVPVDEAERCSCSKLAVCNWLAGIRQPQENPFDCVEVRFKNNRKEYYRLPYGIAVTEGDLVAVDGAPGHDVGIVSLTGELCRIQMKKRHVDPAGETVKKLFRRAKVSDIDRWVEAIKGEQSTLITTRKITDDLGLVMKMNDVEFQGDNSKAIFYYTAEERVDFRALIRILAEQFHVRVEMKQIGVRQEASKVGGLGTCGRELCCSTWLTNFKSVTTSVAKTQQILPNPQKLAGQCGKLKCCLNFEYDVYVDALKKFPSAHVALRFRKGLALYKKTDIFRGVMWYAYEGQNDLYALPAESVKDIMEKNRNQEYPEQMEDYQVELMSTTALEQETSESEFEQAIRQLADKGNEVVRNDDDRRDRPRGRDDRQRGRDDRPYNRERRERPYNRDRRDGDRPNNNDGDRDNRRERPYNSDSRRDGDRDSRRERPYNNDSRRDGDRDSRRERPYNNDSRRDGDRDNRRERPYNNDSRRDGDGDRDSRRERPYNNDSRRDGDRDSRRERPYNNDSRRDGDRDNRRERPYNNDSRRDGDGDNRRERPYNNDSRRNQQRPPEPPSQPSPQDSPASQPSPDVRSKETTE